MTPLARHPATPHTIPVVQKTFEPLVKVAIEGYGTARMRKVPTVEHVYALAAHTDRSTKLILRVRHLLGAPQQGQKRKVSGDVQSQAPRKRRTTGIPAGMFGKYFGTGVHNVLIARITAQPGTAPREIKVDIDLTLDSDKDNDVKGESSQRPAGPPGRKADAVRARNRKAGRAARE